MNISGVAAGLNPRGEILVMDDDGDNSLWRNGTLHSASDLLPVSRGWSNLELNDMNDSGAIVGTADDTAGNTHGVLLLPLEVKRVWSDQLPGVEANYLADNFYNGQDSVGTGNDDRDYIFLGAAQSSQFSGAAHLKAQVVISGDDSLRTKILWRLATYNVLGNLNIAAGSSTYAVYDASSHVVSVTADKPDFDAGPLGINIDYLLVGGFDTNGNGQLDANEATILPLCLYKGRHLPFKIKLVTKQSYDIDMSKLHLFANTTPFYHAANLLDAFLTDSIPSEATSSEPTTIDRLEAGLDHPVGILFDANQSSAVYGLPRKNPPNSPLPHAGPGISTTAIFGPQTPMARDIAGSKAFADWLESSVGLPSHAATVRQYFLDHPNEISTTFDFPISIDKEGLQFNVYEDPDLFFAFGKVSVSMIVSVSVDRGLYVNSITLTGDVVDLYDFNHDGAESLLVQPGASVQAGYNTLGNGGKVFKSRVHMDNTDILNFQFKFSE